MNDLPVIGTVGALGVYNLLYWNVVAGDSVMKRKKRQVTITGVTAHTPPNTIGFGVRSRLENGVPYISSTYATSTIDHFDLYVPDYANNGDRNTIYYGCISVPLTEATTPTSCVITAQGFDAAGNPVAKVDFAFKSLGGALQPMTGGSFPKEFVGLKRVEFSVSPKTVAVELDNIVTRLYQRK